MLPIASSGSEPKLSLSENWDRIEEAYGCSLEDDVRQRILQATTVFVSFEVFERTARPLKDAIEYVSSIRGAANALQNALAGSFKGSVDATSYAESLIKQNFRDSRLKVPRYNGPFDALSGVLTSLAVACSDTLREMESPDAPGHCKGECWADWIRSLTKIASEFGLPRGVSKGSDKSAQISPFTLFVEALRECVPKDARRHHHSNAALAKAINNARSQSNGTHNSRARSKKVPPKIGQIAEVRSTSRAIQRERTKKDVLE